MHQEKQEHKYIMKGQWVLGHSPCWDVVFFEGVFMQRQRLDAGMYRCIVRTPHHLTKVVTVQRSCQKRRIIVLSTGVGNCPILGILDITL